MLNKNTAVGKCLENSCPEIFENNYKEMIKFLKIDIFPKQPFADVLQNRCSWKFGKIY